MIWSAWGWKKRSGQKNKIWNSREGSPSSCCCSCYTWNSWAQQKIYIIVPVGFFLSTLITNSPHLNKPGGDPKWPFWILNSLKSMTIQMDGWFRFKPGVTAVQLRLHPVCVPALPFMWKKIITVLLLVVMVCGWKYSLCDRGFEEEPQLFSIKIVPSPSVILTKSFLQLRPHSTSNWVNSSLIVFPLSTFSVYVLLRFEG